MLVPWPTGQAARSTSTPTPNLPSGSSVDQIYSITPVGGVCLVSLNGRGYLSTLASTGV